MEQRGFAKNVPLDIYGGMLQSRKKYLDEDSFSVFYNTLYQNAENLSTNEIKDLKPLLLSLTVMKLELLRTSGIGINGYKRSADAPINDEVDILIKRVLDLSSQTGIKTYNEIGSRITDYLNEWNTEIIKKPYSNLLFGKKVKLDFKPDEDYTDPAMLTDGALGFSDYFNNWMICTEGTLSVNIDAQDVNETKILEMDFLKDSRHNIYPPEKVEVTIGSRKYQAVLPLNNEAKISKIHMSIAIDIQPSDKYIYIKTIKSPAYKNKAIACDEIFLKK